MHHDTPIDSLVSRRKTLLVMGAAAGAAIIARWAPSRRVLAASCVARPEQTEGPYFVDERLHRSDIRSDPGDGTDRPGMPLALTFVASRIEDGSCVPLSGAIVDVWQCDAAGIYSDVVDPRFDTRGKKFLRGHQVTDAAGVVRFTTIWPGWYPGRTVHVHFKIRLDPTSRRGFAFTSQLYFDDALTDVVHAQQPYAARGRRTIRNADDGIFRRGGAELLLAPKPDGAGGYTAGFDVALAVPGSRSG